MTVAAITPLLADSGGTPALVVIWSLLWAGQIACAGYALVLWKGRRDSPALANRRNMAILPALVPCCPFVLLPLQLIAVNDYRKGVEGERLAGEYVDARFNQAKGEDPDGGDPWERKDPFGS